MTASTAMPASIRKRDDGDSHLVRRLFELRSLLIAAAILHVCVTVAVFMVGKYELFPSQFSPNGIGRFAGDGEVYQLQVADLNKILKSEGIRRWATWPTQLHVRLYSLPLAIVSRWSSFNILIIEPLNLFYYLAILFFVFKITQALFDFRTAFIAATIVALWPSFLLHTTQLLRDPLLILAFVVLIWCWVELILRNFSWQRLLVMTTGTIISLVTIRIVRLPMWNVMLFALAVSIILFVVQSVLQRRLRKEAIAYAVLAIASVLIIPMFQPYFHNQQELGAGGNRRFIENEQEQLRPVDEQIYRRREAFQYTVDREGRPVTMNDGSRIDPDVRLDSVGAIIRQVPRALEVGLFAPFPNMWLHAGRQVGLSGRVIAGFETLLTYVIESLALFGLWARRRNLAAWLLAAVIGVGAVALGLVVSNIGAMYRLRYPFWVLMVILCAGGIRFLVTSFKFSKSIDVNSSREVSS